MPGRSVHPPVIGGTSTWTLTEDGTLTANGTLTITDVDASDNPISFPDEFGTLGDNGYGSFELTGGTWSYTLNNALTAVQALDVGETLTDTHTFTASDGTTQSVTITINGAEDSASDDGGTATDIGPIFEDPDWQASENNPMRMLSSRTLCNQSKLHAYRKPFYPSFP